MANTITPTIINLNTAVAQASRPSQLQQSGAVVSCGGTTLQAGATQFCGNMSDLSGILQAAAGLASLSWSGGIVTATIAVGALPANTYFYKVTALGPTGETVGSNEVSVTTTGANSSVALAWGAVSGATGYKVYRGTAAGSESVFYTPGNVTSFTDTGAAGTNGTVPVSNTTTLSAPTANTPTTATTGGTLAAATYYYKVTAINAVGETLPSAEVSIATTGSTSTTTVTWSSVTGATGYKIYRGTAAGAESVYYTVGAVTTFTDTGATSTAGTPPTSNSTTISPPVAATPTTEPTGGAFPQAPGTTFTVIIAGATPAGYNGTFIATITGGTTFTYPLAVSPGVESVAGTYTLPSVGFLIDAFTSFFAQGTSVGAYVLELGPEASDAAGIAALQTWIANNDQPQQFYAYLLPGAWDEDDAPALNTFCANYSSAQGLRYFFVTTTSTNLPTYAGTKSVFAVVPSPTAAPSEHDASGPFYQWLVNNPGPANKLAPMAFRFLFGITSWVQKGNGATINGILSAFGNIALQAAEGGLSNVALYKGTTMDGVQAAAWYGIDWVQIQEKQALAAAVINGSNQQPPLLYDQNGINSLQAVAQGIANNAVAFGCASSAVVTAVSFADYVAANPNDYAAGIYNGLACTMTTQNGFLSITFNLSAVQFA